MTAAVAIVGTGDWARHALAPALMESKDARLVACVSPDSDDLARFASDFTIPSSYGSIDALLRDQRQLDLLVVATPDSVHASAMRAAFAAGIAVYCEKPLATTVADADALARDSARAAAPATVGFSFRYSDAVQRLRADLTSGLLGEPWFLEMREQNTQFHPEVGRPMTWKQDPAHAPGGALFEYGAHILDLGAWLLGPTVDVLAAFSRVTPAARLDDIAALQLRYPSRVLATAVASWVLPGGFPGSQVVLHAAAGTAEVLLDDARSAGDIYRRTAADGTVREEAHFPPAGRHGYAARHLSDLLAVIRAEQPRYPDTLPTVPQAAHVQHVLDAALTATQERRVISATGR
jgi:predicted dehydrogenase